VLPALATAPHREEPARRRASRCAHV